MSFISVIGAVILLAFAAWIVVLLRSVTKRLRREQRDLEDRVRRGEAVIRRIDDDE